MIEKEFNKLSEKEKSQFNQATKDLIIEIFVLESIFYCFKNQCLKKMQYAYISQSIPADNVSFRLIQLIDFIKDRNQFQYVYYMIDKFVFTKENEKLLYQEDLISYTIKDFLNLLKGWKIALKEDMKYIKHQKRAIKTIENKVRKILNDIYWNYEEH